MSKLPEPPEMFKTFTARFPKLAQAWQLASEAGKEGPMEDKARLLVKLGIAAGGMREGAFHSAVRKAIAGGASRGEVEQVVALAASTLGFPTAVALFSWMEDEWKKT